jgi:hypothetical protein
MLAGSAEGLAIKRMCVTAEPVPVHCITCVNRDRIALRLHLPPDEGGGTITGTELTHVLPCRVLCLVATTCPLCHRPAVPPASSAIQLQLHALPAHAQPRARPSPASSLPLLVFTGACVCLCTVSRAGSPLRQLMVTWGDHVLFRTSPRLSAAVQCVYSATQMLEQVQLRALLLLCYSLKGWIDGTHGRV